MKQIRYKDKNDIPYFKFAEFQSIVGDSKDPELISSEVMRLFYPKQVQAEEYLINDLANAVQRECKPKLNFVIDLTFNKAEKFINCENYIRDQELVEFLKLVIKPKNWWQRIDFKKLSVADVEYVCQLFLLAQQI